MTVCYGRSNSQTELVELHLFDTRAAGDVAGLAPLRKLEDVALQGTRVSGDIAAFARHPELRPAPGESVIKCQYSSFSTCSITAII